MSLGVMPVEGRQATDQTFREEYKGGPPLICGQQNVRVTTRDYTGQNTDKGHSLSPRIEMKFLTPPGIKPGPSGLKAGILQITPEWHGS